MGLMRLILIHFVENRPLGLTHVLVLSDLNDWCDSGVTKLVFHVQVVSDYDLILAFFVLEIGRLLRQLVSFAQGLTHFAHVSLHKLFVPLSGLRLA